MQFTVLLPQDVQMTIMIFPKMEVARKKGAEFLDAVTGAISLYKLAREAGVLLTGR